MVINAIQMLFNLSLLFSVNEMPDTIVLFNGASLDGWEVVDYTGSGSVRTAGNSLILEQGVTITAVRYIEDLPATNYEVYLEAKRVEGSDFFCGLTFPVKESYNTLVIGGWGGTVVGLSCIDEEDAYDNITYTLMDFEMDRWYKILLKVTETKIEAWIDNNKIVDLEIEGYKLSLRWEVESCIPFGIATWRTTGAIRNIYVVRNIE